MTLSTMLKKRSTGEAGELINSSDIPDGTKTVNIVIAGIRETPEEFNAPAIIDFEIPLPPGTDRTPELLKCMDYCKECLLT